MERIKLAQERTGKDPSTGQERKENERVPREKTEKGGTHEHKKEKKMKW